MKRIAIVPLLTLLACGAPVASGPSPTPSPTETSSPSPSLQEETYLLFALKEGTTVTVYRLGEGDGRERLFSYEENAEADAESGNYYDGQPPSAALRPGSDEVLVAGADGIAVHDLAAGDRRVLVELVEPREGDSFPVWAPPFDGYALVDPVFSADGSIVAFSRSQYEGSQEGLVRLSSGAYFEIEGMPLVYIDREALRWAGDATAWIAPARGGYYLGETGALRQARQVTIDGIERVIDAQLSPDAGRVVFNHAEEYHEPSKALWVAASDGSALEMVTDRGEPVSPFFGPDGSVWWIDAKTGSLWRRTGDRIRTITELDTAFEWRWLGWWDGRIALAGRDLQGDRARLRVLDPQDGSVVLRHDASTSFVTYLGEVALPA